MNKSDINFIKAAGIKVIDSTLFFIIEADIKNNNDLLNYSYFIKILSSDLVTHSEEYILNIIKKISKTELSEYYSGDLIDYLGNSKSIKFFTLKVDYRDKEFPYIFDGFYSIELSISCNLEVKANYFTFDCSTTEENYSNIKQSQIDKFIILISSNIDTHSIVFKDINHVVEIIFPSEDSKNVKPIIKIEEVKPTEEEFSSVKKDGKNYIYIASNKYMTALKIGYTSNIAQRLTELSSNTAVPTNFKLEYKREFQNAPKVERYIFKAFNEKGYRVSSKREFFTIQLHDAISFINNISENEIQ